MRQALGATAHADRSGCSDLLLPTLSPPIVRFLNSYATTVQTQLTQGSSINGEHGDGNRSSEKHRVRSGGSCASSRSASGLLRMNRSEEAYDPARAQPIVLRGIVGSEALFARLSAEYPLPNVSGGLIGRALLKELTTSRREYMTPSNFQIWYDSPLMALILAHSHAWRLFDKYLNSPGFLADVIAAFGPQLDNPEQRFAGLLADPASRRHVHS